MSARWIELCSSEGPIVSEGPEIFHKDVTAMCERHRGHTGAHHWWNDEGNVKVKWLGEAPFFFGDKS